jgi:hypothetical protein
MLLATSPAYASNSDALSKLKDIQKQEQTTTPDVLLPNLNGSTGSATVPSAAEIKAELDVNANNQLNDLKATASNSVDPTDHFKLAIAYELIGDTTNAITSIHNAIHLAPNQIELYKELVSLFSTQNPSIISVFVNGDKIDFKDGNDEVNPVIVSGSTLVPIRKITEKLGAKVDWNNDTHTATIRLLDTTIQLIQDSTNAMVNGNKVTLEVPAQNIGGHILVPLRFISEQVNKNVDYIPGVQGTAIIPIVDKN